MISWTKSTFVNLTGSKYKPADYSFLCILQLNLLSAIQHENLVPLLGYCCEYDQQILVYPFMSNGSLQDRLYGTSHPKFFSSIIFSFIYIYFHLCNQFSNRGSSQKKNSGLANQAFYCSWCCSRQVIWNAQIYWFFIFFGYVKGEYILTAPKERTPKYTWYMQQALNTSKKKRDKKKEKKNSLLRAKPINKVYHGQWIIIYVHSNPFPKNAYKRRFNSLVNYSTSINDRLFLSFHNV